jgi:hypothetical protein
MNEKNEAWVLAACAGSASRERLVPLRKINQVEELPTTKATYRKGGGKYFAPPGDVATQIVTSLQVGGLQSAFFRHLCSRHAIIRPSSARHEH